MNLASTIHDLTNERDRIDQALTVLKSMNGTRVAARGGRRRMSAEGRRRISLAQKARWRKQKKAV